MTKKTKRHSTGKTRSEPEKTWITTVAGTPTPRSTRKGIRDTFETFEDALAHCRVLKSQKDIDAVPFDLSILTPEQRAEFEINQVTPTLREQTGTPKTLREFERRDLVGLGPIRVTMIGEENMYFVTQDETRGFVKIN